MFREGRHKITLELPYNTYKGIEKIAYMRGSSIENTILELLKINLGTIIDLDSNYKLRYSKVPHMFYENILKSVRRGEITIPRTDRDYVIKNYIEPLGILVTILIELYRRRIPVRVYTDELEKRIGELREIIERVAGPVEKPVDYVHELIKKIEPIAPAVDITIRESIGGGYELIFRNPAYLENLYGVGTKPLKRRLFGD